VVQLQRIVQNGGHLQELPDNIAVGLVQLLGIQLDVGFGGHELGHAFHEDDSIRFGVCLGGYVRVRVVALD